MTIVYFLLMMALLVVVHEFGHMIVAKAFGVYVKEFSVGMGPLLWKKQGKETQYSLRAIPLGGYNMMIEKPEDQEGMDIPFERTFFGVSPFKRILILIAGPLFNIITALLICIALFVSIGSAVVYPQAKVVSVMDGLPASKAGIQVGDIITKIVYEDGDIANISDTYDLTINNALHEDDKQSITIDRNGQIIIVELKPEYSQEDQRYLMGIQFEGAQVQKLNLWQCIVKGAQYTWDLVYYTVDGLKLLLIGTLSSDNITGTIGIYNYTAEAVESGIESYFALVADISISLAIMNLLPIPVLDGGKIILSLIEKILGRRLNQKVENFILYVGLAIIVLIFLYSTYCDLSKLLLK